MSEIAHSSVVEVDLADPVGRALQNLTITHERTGAELGRADVARVARRFVLDPPQIAELEARAEAVGLLSVATEDEPSAARETSAGTDIDLLALFRRDVGQVRLLTAQEEVALGDAFNFGREAEATLESGDSLSDDAHRRLEASVQRGRAAFEEFVRCNIPLVMRIATWNQMKGLEYSDLVQIGVLGLMRAVERWDPHRGYRFTTFAYYWIRQMIARGLADTGRAIRLPVHMVESIHRIDKTRDILAMTLRRTPTINEIAEATGLEPEKVALCIDLDASLASLDAPVSESQGTTLVDLQRAPAEGPQDIMVRNERTAVLWCQLRRLSPREQVILVKRFGLDGQPTMTLEQLGEVYGVTRERIRQIEARAIKRLRKLVSVPNIKEVLAS